MNTNSLAKYYCNLTPQERLPLIVAATVRGDKQERDRLIQSAPKVNYSVSHYFGLAKALQDVGDLHFMRVLDIAASFFSSLDSLGKEEDEAAGIPLLLGFILKTMLAGWRQFCDRHGFPGNALWEPLPGFETICWAERLAENIAFLPEGAAAYLGRQRPGEPGITVEMICPESIAADLDRCLKDQAEWWG